jgi:hypothetical protein
MTVSDGAEATEIDLAADARIRPAEVGPLGPMLAAEELGADKVLALFDRAQARDFVDVSALVEQFGLERLCQLATEKDRTSRASGLAARGARQRPSLSWDGERLYFGRAGDIYLSQRTKR